MLLFNCETNLILTWSANCDIAGCTTSNQATSFSITNTKTYVSVATLSTDDNPKLLQQLKSGFKLTIRWHKYQSKVTIQTWNQYLDYAFDSNFQVLNRNLALIFENNAQWALHTRCFLTTIDIKGYNVMIDGRYFLISQQIYLRTYDNIQKISTGQGDDYTTSFLLDYRYLKS